MTNFKVQEAYVARQLPPKDDWPAKNVLHYTLQNGESSVLVTSFEKTDFSLPSPGSTIEGDLGEPDKFDKDRRKFTRAGSRGRGGGRSGGRSPQETKAIQRQHSQEMALRFTAIKASLGTITDFTFDDVRSLTNAFEDDLLPAAPKSDVPADTEGLPELNTPPF